MMMHRRRRRHLYRLPLLFGLGLTVSGIIFYHKRQPDSSILLCGEDDELFDCKERTQTNAAVVEEIVVVTDHGVVGDGIVDDTSAMRKILSDSQVQCVDFVDCPCYRHNQRRRVVIIPEDVVVSTYPLNITSCTTLQVDGRLVAIPNITIQQKWPVIPPLENYASSEDGHGLFTLNQYHPFIYVHNATNVRITGRGVIDGSGPYFWDLFRRNDPLLKIGGRPNLLQTVYSTNIELDSVTFVDSAFWTIHPVLSSDIHIHHIKIRAPMYAPNVDGIDPDSCINVVIEHCDVACGDDHIAIKAGVCGVDSDERYRNKCTKWIGGRGAGGGRTGPYVTRNVTVRNNVFRTGMGIAIGSEMSGSVQNINIYNNTVGLCEFGHGDTHKSCGWGPALHIKTTITRSGTIENVLFENNIVYNTSMFMWLHTDYQVNKNQTLPAQYPKTLIRNITFRNNHALGMARHVGFECSAIDYCHNITVVNNTIKDKIGPDDADDGPWTCAFIDSYEVEGNHPSGLRSCMANSMNNSITDWAKSKNLQQTIHVD